MNKYFPLAGLMLFSSTSFCQDSKLNCERMHKGKFLLHGGEFTTLIERTDSIQTEMVETDSVKIKNDYYIRWVDECTYQLIPTEQTLIKDKDLRPDMILTVRILHVNGNSCLLETSCNFSDFTSTDEVIKVD